MAVPCPECGYDMSQVIDSRTNGDVTRRRRECMECGHRYTTFEGVKIRSRKQIYQEVKDDLRENLIIALNEAVKKTFSKADD